MSEKSLEKAIKDKIKPLLDKVTRESLGFSIEKLNEDIIDKLEKPVLRFKIDTSIPFKIAKKDFKKQFFENLLRGHLGNISEVARISGMDRRSVHRAIKDLDINIDKYREEMIRPDQYRVEVVDEAVKDSLEEFKEIINQDKLKNIYQSIMEKDEIKHIPLREPKFDESEKEFERQYIEYALRENNHLITKTAKKIGLRYETLIRKMKSLGL
ncbi:MAG: helix-turn-helix domain-containing protein [Nanoarchaeota archaeon]|nr:helix-turn-helix domain-containing protein [Nanoarchaeota archaeon]